MSFAMEIGNRIGQIEPRRKRMFLDLIAATGLGRAELASFLEVDPRELRRWCDGTGKAPRMALLALEHLMQLRQAVSAAATESASATANAGSLG